MAMKFHFVNTNEATHIAYKRVLEQVIPGAQFHNSRIRDIAPTCDTLVSASNSRLFFDGGSDLDYIHLFKRPELPTRLKLREFWHRNPAVFNPKRGAPPFLPVGAAMRVEINEKNFVVVPTMALPQPVSDTENAKHAFKIMLELLDKRPELHQNVLVPSFCTGVGRMDASVSALQVAAGWEEHARGIRYDVLYGVLEDLDVAYDPKVMSLQPKYYMNSLFMETAPEDIIPIPRR